MLDTTSKYTHKQSSKFDYTNSTCIIGEKLSQRFFKDISPGDALHSLDNPSPALDLKRQKNTILSTLISFSLDNLIKEFRCLIQMY